MQILDLRQNRIATVDSIKPLLRLAKLQRLVLISNPVADRSAAFTEALPEVCPPERS